MPTNHSLTPEDRRALQKIPVLLRKYPGQYGHLTNPTTQKYAHTLQGYPPAEAIRKAEEYRQEVQTQNDKEEAETKKAAQRKAELAKPYYSLGRSGLIGIMLRSLMASINWTPFISPNWYEMTDRGLIIHTPFANVTERLITHADLAERRRELGVNPPAYFDAILNFLKQLRFKVSAPWGSITVREPGSGVILAELVDFWPEINVAKLRKDLTAIHRANNPYATHLVLPKLVDFYSYYIDEWDDEYRIASDVESETASEAPTVTESSSEE
ncbi:MAG TPA: hypothetical protein PKE45_09935 [Caldilineaceae bacterium]|nr:hypothetical protein [Caldilineaceae bacterium]